MKVMKAAELESTGAALTSVFHQLLAGKSGSGTGIGPPCVAPKAVPHATKASATRHLRTIRTLLPGLGSAASEVSHFVVCLRKIVRRRSACLAFVPCYLSSSFSSLPVFSHKPPATSPEKSPMH